MNQSVHSKLLMSPFINWRTTFHEIVEIPLISPLVSLHILLPGFLCLIKEQDWSSALSTQVFSTPSRNFQSQRALRGLTHVALKEFREGSCGEIILEERKDGRQFISARRTGGCLSQPSSPRLSSRLGKVTRLISRSDANLAHSLKGKRTRHDSGDSSHSQMHSLSNTPEDGGSPSKTSSLVARATGYMTHLKSRLGKHREKSKDNQRQRSEAAAAQSFSVCCGNKRQVESSDTIAGAPGTISLPSITDGSIACGSASVSVNVSTTTNNRTAVTTTTNSASLIPSIGLLSTIKNQTIMASSNTFPFYTLNVHLQRGRNLVARDACDNKISRLGGNSDKSGSSDPYVKVKIGDKLHYKSKTIYRDLNPIWDESFVLPINDLSQSVIFKVFDYDWGFQDDFMGMAALDVSRLPPNKAQELSLVLAESINSNQGGAGTSESMGEIFVNVTLVPRTIEEKEITEETQSVSQDTLNTLDTPVISGDDPNRKSFRRSFQEKCAWLTDGQSSARLADSQRRLKSQIWSSVLTVLLLEAKNLSSDKEDRIIMDAFVKFRLGNQKYKSRTVARTTHPKWCEQFDFYLYEGQPQILEVQIYDEAFSRDYIGRCSIDIGLLAKEITHNQTFQLQEGPGEISLLLTISGTCGTETISDLGNFKPSVEENKILQSRYTLTRSLHSIRDVGHLTVKVYEATGLAAADIGGKSDPFVVLELVNARLQTQTEYRTLNPIWNKIFTFAVKDYTSLLEVTVYDEDRHHKTEFLGKLSIPLWKIKNGEKKWYPLKDRKLLRAARGNNPQILLEMELIWNPVRAGIRIMDPPEPKFLMPDNRLKREVFLLNIDRLRKIGVGIFDTAQYIQSCMEWEYPVRSIIALSIYEILCYTFQPYMIPLFIMLLILKQWLVCAVTGTALPEDFPEDETLVLDDDEEESQGGEGDEKKMSLRQKLQAVQDATQTLQNALGDIASVCESTRNTLRMVIPFISWLAVIGLFFATILLYFVPLRYLAMGWGLHRFLRPLIRPNFTPTNELFNLIVRVPDNQELLQFKPIRVLSSPDVQRNRSPPGKAPVAKKAKYKFW
ncbi:unnamed protein product [Allacma fusca]|uniref:C2 domain-containing protein n=1 Tax=Allacma fusca TaxID=39272 RepID=A0A8J2L8H9_9HEXA|nr:unnamed protein product [Allacma fusca]